MPYAKVLNEHNIGFPTVHVETDFKKPLRYGDSVRIDVELADVGTRSITMRYVATRLPDGTHSASATIKKVCIDNESFTSVDIPDEWRERFARFRSGESK